MKRDSVVLNLILSFFVLASILFSLPISSFAEVDITSKVQLNKSALIYDRRAGTSSMDVSLKNASLDVLLSPIKLVIDSISVAGVKVANADGVTSDGKPYFLYSFPNAIPPGQLTTAKRWVFSNPTQARFSYSIKAIGSVSYLRINAMNPSAALPGETVTVTFSGDSGVSQYRLPYPLLLLMRKCYPKTH